MAHLHHEEFIISNQITLDQGKRLETRCEGEPLMMWRSNLSGFLAEDLK